MLSFQDHWIHPGIDPPSTLALGWVQERKVSKRIELILSHCSSQFKVIRTSTVHYASKLSMEWHWPFLRGFVSHQNTAVLGPLLFQPEWCTSPCLSLLMWYIIEPIFLLLHRMNYDLTPSKSYLWWWLGYCKELQKDNFWKFDFLVRNCICQKQSTKFLVSLNLFFLFQFWYYRRGGIKK